MAGKFFLSVLLASIAFCTSCPSVEEPLDPKSIRKVDGFEVELLRVAEKGEDSWISLAFDNRDRVILGLDKMGVGRLTLQPDGKAEFERIESTLKHCRGVLFAFNSIYVNSTDSKILVRLSDRDHDDNYETREDLISYDYRSRYGHGANQMRLGPDNKIYIVVGNDVSFPTKTLDSSPYWNPQNDWVLTEARDKGQDSRVGYILRIDSKGNNREVIAGGFRNPVDLAFDPNGEMFTFDADMEWDIGAPWYRPIRINHIVSGGDYGWRWGTGKWPAYYPDSLPSNLDVGMGSPTGVTFGTNSQYPSRYRNALFVADWQNGKVFAAFPKQNGASYRFDYESFLDGAPLNVCDMEFGRDGKLYFITGGRGSQSALYRVSWTGKRASTEGKHQYPPMSPLHSRRRRLEALHYRANSNAIDFAWKELGNDDPWIRNAARIAIERQEVTQWEQRVFDETDTEVAIYSLLALVRMKKTDSSTQLEFHQRVVRRVLELSAQMNAKTPSENRLIELGRIFGILFARHGLPNEETAQSVFQYLYRYFPSQKESVDQELCELLVLLGIRGATKDKEWSPFWIRAMSSLLEDGRSQENQIHLARSLAHVPQPWPEPLLNNYVKWLGRANGFRGGHLLPKTIIQMKADFESAVKNSQLSQATKQRILADLGKISKTALPSVVPNNRQLVRNWMTADLADLDHRKGDPKRGKKVFIQAQCAACHRKADVGSMIGPDLTNVGGQYNQSSLLESILLPSLQIDPKYALSTYATVDGKTHTGRVHSVNAKSITIEVDPILQTTVALKRDEIEMTRPAKSSPMPTGLLNYFDKPEIADLLSFLLRR